MNTTPPDTLEHLTRRHYEIAAQLQILEMSEGVAYMLRSPLNRKLRALDKRIERLAVEEAKIANQKVAKLHGLMPHIPDVLLREAIAHYIAFLSNPDRLNPEHGRQP